eukprot:844489_1
MKTKCVKETLKHIHHQKDSKCGGGENTETKECCEKVHVQSGQHGLLPEHSSKFGMGKRQCPKTEVGCSVGNHTKNEFNSFDSLVNNDFSKTMVLIMSITLHIIMMPVLHILGNKVRLGKKKDGY